MLIFHFSSLAQKARDVDVSNSSIVVADSLYKTGNYSQAIAIYQKDASASSQLKMARSYKNLGRMKEALQTFEVLVSNHPDQVMATYEYVKTLVAEKQYKKADSLFEKLTTAYPENLEFVYQLGLSKEAQNDALALPAWLYIIQKDTLHLNAHYKLGLHFTKTANFSKAKNHVDKGLSQQPDSKRFLTLKGLAYFYEKDYHNTIKIFEKLMALGQSNEQVHEKLAISYQKTNRYEDALEKYTLLLEQYDAKNPTWHFELGLVYNALGEREKAIEHIETSKELLNPSLSNHYLTLATIYKRTGDYKQVFETLREALKDEPTNEMIQYQFAVAGDNYYKDKKAIVALYESYISQFPEGRFTALAQQRIADLKKELFIGEE